MVCFYSLQLFLGEKVTGVFQMSHIHCSQNVKDIWLLYYRGLSLYTATDQLIPYVSKGFRSGESAGHSSRGTPPPSTDLLECEFDQLEHCHPWRWNDNVLFTMFHNEWINYVLQVVLAHQCTIDPWTLFHNLSPRNPGIVILEYVPSVKV